MKKTLFYSAIALSISLAGCQGETTSDTTTGEATELNELHEEHMDMEAVSREDHIKLVKAEEVQPFQNVDQQVQAHLSNLTTQYLQLKDALVASNPAQASTAAADLLASIQNWDGPSLPDDQKSFFETRVEEIEENLEQITNTQELSNQRDHFARLSKHMTELIMAFGTGKGSLYYQYCPMAFDNKGGYWLSNSKEIRNPFYGDEMLTCGRVAQTL